MSVPRQIGIEYRASSIGNRFMFTGREWSELGGRDVDGQAERPSERERTSQWIEELQVYDYRHRFYLPATGRFLQTDPIGLQTEGAKLSAQQKALFSLGGQAPEAFGSSEMNLYRYSGDDPVDNTDPSGLIPMSVDDEADVFAQRANQGNRAALMNNTIPFTSIVWPTEFGTAVDRNNGTTTLNGPVRGNFFSDRVPLATFVGPTTIIVTHNHPNQATRDTNSFLSFGDVLTSNRIGKPIYVITPDGQQDRFRPSDKPTLRERLNDPGVIERLRDGKWLPVPGSKPDIRENPRLDPKLWR